MLGEGVETLGDIVILLLNPFGAPHESGFLMQNPELEVHVSSTVQCLGGAIPIGPPGLRRWEGSGSRKIQQDLRRIHLAGEGHGSPPPNPQIAGMRNITTVIGTIVKA